MPMPFVEKRANTMANTKAIDLLKQSICKSICALPVGISLSFERNTFERNIFGMLGNAWECSVEDSFLANIFASTTTVVKLPPSRGDRFITYDVWVFDSLPY